MLFLLSLIARRLYAGKSVRWLVAMLVGLIVVAVGVYAYVYATEPASSSSDNSAATVEAQGIAAVTPGTPYVAPTISTPGDDQLVQDYCHNPTNTHLSVPGCICTLRTLAAQLGFAEARRRWNELADSSTVVAGTVVANLFSDVPLIANCS
ncbi:MAG TPA: hypothetical protein VEZ14_00020 [Dehalococcoidia bacterium]|nr:hypothetical protein [Dehalococcoidia bacterium]